MIDMHRALSLLSEAYGRIQEIGEAAKDHEELGETLAIRIEDALALSDDIAVALHDAGVTLREDRHA